MSQFHSILEQISIYLIKNTILLFMQNLKRNDTNELIYKTETDSQT